MKPTPTSPALPPTDFEEFELLINQTSRYFGHFLTCIVLYAATLGVLLKFFFDSPSGAPDRIAFFVAGFLLNLIGLIGVILIIFVSYLPFVRRSKELADRLGIPEIYHTPILISVGIFQFAVIMASGAWLALILLF